MSHSKALSAGSLALLLLACFQSSAQEPKTPKSNEKGSSMELKTEKVIVFKDGYALVLKKGVATTNERGEIHTDQVPEAAVLGSFWAVPSEGRLVSMKAGWSDAPRSETKTLPCTETIEVLLANEGKQAKVVLADKTTLSGTIKDVLVREGEAPLPVNLGREVTWLGFERGASPAATLSTVSGSRFVLTTEAGDVLVSAAEVRTLTVADMQTTLERTVRVEERKKRLTFRFAEKNAKKELTVMYFRPGLRWIPSYRVQLGDREGREGTARVTLQAELVNEAEDLRDVPVDIVVGVPNFRFKGTVSPLVLETSLRGVVAQAHPQLFNNGLNALSNAAFTSQVVASAPTQVAPTRPESVSLPDELTAAGAQDLFVYSLPPLDLAEGERAAMTITSVEAPYEHVYTWDVRVRRQDLHAAPPKEIRSPLNLEHNQVWHQIDLRNTGDIPWTTGAALVTQGDQPLCQELLTYTSPGGAVRLPLTVSVDTRGTLREKETDRQLQALRWDCLSYAKISKQAVLSLQNAKRRAIKVEVAFTVGGQIDAASHQGQVTVMPYDHRDWHGYRGSPVVNNSSTARWTVELGAGKRFDPAVDYHYFARH